MTRSLRRYAVAAAVLPALVVGVSACGSATAPSAASSPTLAPAVPVTAQVDGRAVHGHCRGKQQSGPAVLLESGLGGGADELAVLEEHLASRTLVCAYDRAGVRTSDPAAGVSTEKPRPLDDLVTDLDAFAAASGARAPYVLVGQSLGATVAVRYAQTHPDRVSGFVAMNPVPPEKTYLKRVRAKETAGQYRDEVAFYGGENDEEVDLASSEKQRTGTLPPSVRYTVMFDEDCDGDTDFCARVLPALALTTRELATRNAGGTFVAAPGAGHQILATKPDLVLRTVDGLLAD